MKKEEESHSGQNSAPELDAISCGCGSDVHDHVTTPESHGKPDTISCGCGSDAHDHDHSYEMTFLRIWEENKKLVYSLALVSFLIAIAMEWIYGNQIYAQIFSALTVLLTWWDVLQSAISEVKAKKLKANTLMIVAAIGSFLIGHGQEGAAAIFLYSISEELESFIIGKSNQALESLIKLAPNSARLVEGNEMHDVLTDDILQGQIIRVKPGEKIPLDGEIIAGKTRVNNSSLTGEADLIPIEIGDQVYAGTYNEDGVVDIKVLQTSGNTTLAKIVELMNEARKKKSTTERFIQRFATYYTPFVFFVSLSTIFGFIFLGNVSVEESIYRGLVLLVISCPCALTLSTPISIVAGLAKLSREGILVKGSQYLEALEKIKVIAFDKTGTLTKGQLEIQHIVPTNTIQERQFMEILGSLEQFSEHSIALPVIQYLEDKGISLLEVTNFRAVKGKGILGTLENIEYTAGNPEFIQENGIVLNQAFLSQNRKLKTTIILLADLTNKKILGYVSLADKMRLSAPYVLYQLNKKKYRTILLSGDRGQSVKNLAGSVYLTESQGELLPQEKLSEIADYQSKKMPIIMVGDGINDAPALSAADVGIAIGDKATDIAIESSDISILSNNLFKLLVLFDISKMTNRKIKQNIWLSILVKFAFIILTVLGWMSLWLAVGLGDVGLSLLVMLNGFLTFGYQNPYKKESTQEDAAEFTKLLCPHCDMTTYIKMHHGKRLRPQGESLVCWLEEESDGFNPKCEYRESLHCPMCHEKLVLQ